MTEQETQAKPEVVKHFGRQIAVKTGAGFENGDFTKLKESDVFRFVGDTTEWTVDKKVSDTEVLATHN